MADQKALKKRLKVLMQRPENQVCSDCPEKKPTWASLIVPPPGAPPGTEKIGAFCCLECSGSHRRLGVHISFVRSVNLDAWKEWEVKAMENGGNAKVNAIFEAHLSRSGRSKPTNLADGQTRERYIRDKYERRKFYDPAGFSGDYSSFVPQPSGNSSGAGAGGSLPGTPSEIARQRVANRQAQLKPTQSNVFEAKPAAAAEQKVAQAPVSAPVVFDLLDFGAEFAPAPSAPTSDVSDPFLTSPALVSVQALPSTQHTSGGNASQPMIPPSQTTSQQSQSSTSGQSFSHELLNNHATSNTTKVTSNESIMALFGAPQQQHQPQGSGYGMQSMTGTMPSGMSNNRVMMGGGMMPQQSNQYNMNGFGGTNGMMNGNPPANNYNFGFAVNHMTHNNNINNPPAMTMMMHQQQPMMMHNNMMGGSNGMMMNPQFQQQMMMSHQQQQQPNQSPMGMNRNNGMPGCMGTNNFNNKTQGMQHNMGITRQSSDDGGFGAPMGGSAQQQTAKSDPFSSLGGMNAFR